MIVAHFNADREADGLFQYLDLDGTVICELTFVKGQFMKEGTPYNGNFQCKDQASRLRLNADYKEGREDGVFQMFSSNNKMIMEQNYRNGKLDGVSKNYDLDGNILCEINYSENVPEGPYTAFYKDGTPSSKAQFHKGELAGKFYTFYPSSITRSEGTFKKNLPREITVYYPDHTVMTKWKTSDSSLSKVEAEYFTEKGEKLETPEAYDEQARKATAPLPGLYYKRGLSNLFLQRGSPEETILDLTKAIQEDPQHHYAYLYRGFVNFSLGQYTQAIEDFTKVKDTLSSDYSIKDYLARAYHYRGWNYYDEKKKYPEAILDSLWVIEHDPNYARLEKVYNNLGCAYDAMGDPEKAVEYYNKAIALNHYYKAYYNRGIYYQSKNKNAEAIEDYERTIKIRADYDWAYNNLANMYSRERKYDQVLNLYQKAITFDPTDVFNNTGLAYAYANLGKFDLAEKQLELISAVHPNDPSILNCLAFVLNKKGDPSAALKLYDQVIETAPSAAAYVNRGEIYEKQGQFDTAIEDYRRAKGLDPKYINSFWKLANALIIKSELHHSQPAFDEAKALLDEAMSLEKENADVIDALGTWHMIKGNMEGRSQAEYAKAVEYFSLAIALAPLDSHHLNNRASVYLNLRQYDKAWDDIHKVQEMGGETSPVLLQMLKSQSGRSN